MENEGVKSCQECAEGQFSEVGAQTCEKCPVGWEGTANRQKCEQCSNDGARDYIAANKGSPECAPCNVGDVANEERSKCIPCTPLSITQLILTSGDSTGCAKKHEFHKDATLINCPTVGGTTILLMGSGLGSGSDTPFNSAAKRCDRSLRSASFKT